MNARHIFAGCAIALAFSGAAVAQSYPNRPVTILTPFAAGSVTDAAARLIAQTLQEALGQSFVVENRAGAGGLLAAGDPERVHQVVANLLDNAVRHSPAEGRVWLTAYAPDAETTRIEVCDEGPGIPEDELGRVFERFYRTDAARSTRDGGTGLGLAIARWIVDAHGGRIRAERREPSGCRMVVELPR